MSVIDGTLVRNQILEELKNKLKEENTITLAIISVGNDDASQIYIKNKQKYCNQVGMKCKIYHLDSNTTQTKLLSLINDLNNDKNIHGIILQSPIPQSLDFVTCSNAIVPEKDVDGFTETSVYKNYTNQKGLLPCTVKGIIRLLDYYQIPIESSHVVIVGRSLIVGKPLAIALTNRNATVTLAHSKTQNLRELCQKADILIIAVGTPKLITEDFVKKGATIIDVGINRLNGKIIGDVDFDNVKDKCAYITKVPGGVGPMTIAMLLENTYEAYKGSENDG